MGLMSMNETERQEYFTNYLVQFYGEEARQAEQLLAFNFNAYETLGGGAQAHFPPKVWSLYGSELRTPYGRIYWSGTEYASVGYGYVNGAIQSGNNTAHTILALLRG